MNSKTKPLIHEQKKTTFSEVQTSTLQIAIKNRMNVSYVTCAREHIKPFALIVLF